MKYNIAIVGATGLVGSTFLKVMEEKEIEVNNLYLYASSRSKGTKINYLDTTYEVLELSVENIIGKEIDYVLASAGASLSKQFAPVFTSVGAVVIDNTSAFRMEQDVPLVVPEVNMEDAFANLGIISNPNCSTIQSVLPLDALKGYGLKSVKYATYQAVSGSGNKGIEDLENTQAGLEPNQYPYSIYNNVLPHIDVFMENGYTKEEIKMIQETRKILHMPDLEVTATCVRVPVKTGHSVDVYVEFDKEVDIEEVKSLLAAYPGIVLVDDVKNNQYPIPTMSAGKNEVFVGRVRHDFNKKNAIHLFVVADNIRKGAATNTVQIMEELMKGVV